MLTCHAVPLAVFDDYVRFAVSYVPLPRRGSRTLPTLPWLVNGPDGTPLRPNASMATCEACAEWTGAFDVEMLQDFSYGYCAGLPVNTSAASRASRAADPAAPRLAPSQTPLIGK